MESNNLNLKKMRKILLILMLFCFSMITQAQNFGEFIVNSHISDAQMQVLYDNCDSLDIIPVFQYFYSDDSLKNEYSEVRMRHISQSFAPCGMINGVPITTKTYNSENLWDVAYWYPLLHIEPSTISFDASSYFKRLNEDESVLYFDLINVQNIEIGDIIQMALVQNIGNKQNVQVKMIPSAYGTEFVGQKTISNPIFWSGSLGAVKDFNVIVWVEKADKTVVFSKEFPIVNKYVNKAPILNYTLNSPNGGDNPTIYNWFYFDASASTDYEDNIYGNELMVSVKWENGWTGFVPITEKLEYRFRSEGTFKPMFILMDSNGDTVTDSTEITIGVVAGIEDFYNEQGMSVYPNPTSDRFNVESADIINTIVIYNISGSVVYKNENVNSYSFNHDVNGWNKGLYFIRVNDKTQKIVVR